MPTYRLAPPHGVGAPSTKSWIRHCNWMHRLSTRMKWNADKTFEAKMNVFVRKEIHYNTSSLCARKYLRKYLQIGRKAGTKKPGRFVKLMHLLINWCRNSCLCILLFSTPFATRLLYHCHTASTGIDVFHICYFMMIDVTCRGYRT